MPWGGHALVPSPDVGAVRETFFANQVRAAGLGDGLHAGKRHQRVALGPGDVRLEPVDRRRGVACAAGLEYLAVIAPREGDVQKGALV